MTRPNTNMFKEGYCVISEAERGGAMGQNDPKTYNQYYTPQAAPNIRSAFLDRPSKNKLIQLLSHMSFDRDPMAKREAEASM
ncbi:hypothetical protein ABW20_dc0105676 [Dactylellina cionopaga]|nr:hypothetical protein ABW20_dc0105676 [Dactylellina cionopaga]